MSGHPGHPIVSVVIPTRNRSVLLRLALEPVLAWTFQDLEAILDGDGSMDDTRATVEAFSDHTVRCQCRKFLGFPPWRTTPASRIPGSRRRVGGRL